MSQVTVRMAIRAAQNLSPAQAAALKQIAEANAVGINAGAPGRRPTLRCLEARGLIRQTDETIRLQVTELGAAAVKWLLPSNIT